ncbi:MAG TPA: C40 family peptidase [Ferruginibacter sp.]|nr:C40 family peptidase [Ferruginibacter sp.]
MRFTILIILLITLTTYIKQRTVEQVPEIVQPVTMIVKDTIVQPPVAPSFLAGAEHINTGATGPQELLAFAKTLIGTPYRYASVDPAIGFDCSGFITYVFNHFKIAVPRSSIDFTNVERQVELADAKPGDLVLFTGTDSTIRLVGHMGIIASKENGEVHFIHSTSGKAYGVTISPLAKYYLSRFVKLIRIFPQNDIGN